MKYIFYILFMFLGFSCVDRDRVFVQESNYRPILMDNERVNDCEFKNSQNNNIITQTKAIDSFLFLLDYGLGVHFVDISDVNVPKKVGFFSIPACIDIDIKNKTLYVNNLNDLLLIDFTTFSQPKIIKREKKVFSININTPDGLIPKSVFNKIPENTTIISYESIKKK